MNALQPWHLIILVLVVVVLFGAKRLPDAARSVGKSMKVFKAETKDLRQSGSSESSDAASSDAAGSATAVGPDARQLPQSSAPQSTDEQVEQLQRQLDELKKQQAQQGAAEQPQRNVG